MPSRSSPSSTFLAGTAVILVLGIVVVVIPLVAYAWASSGHGSL